jgi:hypothetical protein
VQRDLVEDRRHESRTMTESRDPGVSGIREVGKSLTFGIMELPKMADPLTPDDVLGPDERDQLALLAARDAGGVYLSPVRLDELRRMLALLATRDVGGVYLSPVRLGELRRMLDEIAKAPRGVTGPGSRSWALQHLTDYVASLLVNSVPEDRP